MLNKDYYYYYYYYSKKLRSLLLLLTKTINLVHLEPLAKHKQEIGVQTTAK